MKLYSILVLFLVSFISCNWIEEVKRTGVCRAIALSGGGDRGAFEAGVLYGLVHNQTPDKYRWHSVTGISAGAVNAGALAMFKLGEERAAADFIVHHAKMIKKSDVYKHWIPGSIAQGFLLESGIFNSSPLLEFLKKLVDTEAIRNSGRHLEVGAVSIKTGKYRGFNETDPNILLGVYASTAIPGVFPVVKIGDDAFVDGGLTYMTPVSSAIRNCKALGAKEISVDVVLAIGDVSMPGFLNNSMITPSVLLKSVFTIANNILVGDIQTAKLQFPDAKIRVIKPSKWLPGYFLGFNYGAEMVKIGIEDAKNAIRQYPI